MSFLKSLVGLGFVECIAGALVIVAPVSLSVSLFGFVLLFQNSAIIVVDLERHCKLSQVTSLRMPNKSHVRKRGQTLTLNTKKEKSGCLEVWDVALLLTTPAGAN
jgi:hypothetical protein